ncbi:MAG: 7TM diverse intracellular signaling domain-containing protein, partial [Chitinophagaceae bacterium]
MRLLLFITALSINTLIPAQQTDTNNLRSNSVYIADARIQMHELKKYTSIFVDSSNKLTIQEIITEKFSNRFQLLQDSIQARPYITYWLKVSISSTEDIQNWWLLLGQHGYVDAWFLNNSNQITEHQRTGIFVPRSQKKIKENPGLNTIFFSIKSGETKNVYLRFYNEYDPAFITFPQLRNPVIGLPDEKSNMINIFRSGIMLAFSVLSFFFFFFIRDKAYLFFGIYTLSLFLLHLVVHPDLPFLNWVIPEHPHLLEPTFVFLAPGGVTIFIFFGRYFINLPQLSKRLDTVFKWVMGWWIIMLTIIIAFMIVTQRLIPFAEYMYLVFILLFFIFLIRIAFFKSILVRIYVAGALWLVCFIILGLQSVFSLPFNPWVIG